MIPFNRCSIERLDTRALLSQVGSVSVGAQIEALTYGTPGNTTYLVTVERGADAGAFTADSSLPTSLPADVTFSFANPNLSFADGDTSESTILTISTQTGAQATATRFAFTVQAQVSTDSSDSATGDGSLSIAPKLLTASITAANKTYDGTTTATITNGNLPGAIQGDDVGLTGGTAAFSSPDAGTGITVNITGLTLTGTTAGNYSITDTATTTANINPATLTVTADNQSIVSGSALPTLTATDSGFVNGETLATSDVTGAPALSTTATASSSAGDYPITVTQGTLASTNYAFAFVNGTLNVTAPSIAGSWLINGMATTIQETGSALTFINEAGRQSSGGFLSASQIGANTWGSGNLTGNLVNNNTEIDWSNGTVWNSSPL